MRATGEAFGELEEEDDVREPVHPFVLEAGLGCRASAVIVNDRNAPGHHMIATNRIRVSLRYSNVSMVAGEGVQAYPRDLGQRRIVSHKDAGRVELGGDVL